MDESWFNMRQRVKAEFAPFDGEPLQRYQVKEPSHLFWYSYIGVGLLTMAVIFVCCHP